LDQTPFIIIVTGQSGAGKSVAIKTLEDLGFYCIDNLPMNLLIEATETIFHEGKNRQVAIGMDVRDSHFIDDLLPQLSNLRSLYQMEIMYLSADSKVLTNRFNATRRRHPKSNPSVDLLSAIELEAKQLLPVMQVADWCIDTSSLSSNRLTKIIRERFAGRGIRSKLTVSLTSFGFKNGPLNYCDTMIDVRFLANPHWREGLRELTGKDREVQDFLSVDKEVGELIAKAQEFLLYLVPKYLREGKLYFRFGVGCTGGQHRSVFVVEKMAEALRAAQLPGLDIIVQHREL